MCIYIYIYIYSLIVARTDKGLKWCTPSAVKCNMRQTSEHFHLKPRSS